MKNRTKLFVCLLAAMTFILTLTFVSHAAEYSVSNDSEFSAIFDQALDGDSIVITGNINQALDFGKAITYILDGDGIVWSASAQNTATDKTVKIVSRNGSNVFRPNASMWCNSYSLTVKNLSTTCWILEAEQGANLLFDLEKANNRLFYGTFLKEISLKGNVDVTNLYSTTTSGDTNFLRCTTINIYDGVRIFGNYNNRSLIEATNFNMYGGEICGNVCTGMWADIAISSTFTMTGGSIHSNYQTKPHGSYTNPNDPQCVAFITTKNAYVYAGEIKGNFVGLGHDKVNGTVSGIGTRESSLNLYLQDGAIDENILVVTETFGTFTKGADGTYSCVIDPSNYRYVTENQDGTLTYERQYGRAKLNSFSYSVVFKDTDGDVLEAFMITADSTLFKSFNEATELQYIPTSEFGWSDKAYGCGVAVPSLEVGGIYFVKDPTILHVFENDDFNCETASSCANCSDIIEAMTHDIFESISYSNFFETGTYQRCCKNDGCSVINVTEQRKALFGMLGISVIEADSGLLQGSVVQGFIVDSFNLSEYGRINGVTMSFGVVCAVAGNFDKNPLYLDGGVVKNTIEQKVLSFNLTNSKLNAFEIKLTGIKEEYMDTALIYCGYVSDGREIKYIDNGCTLNNAPSRSYNETLAFIRPLS